MQIKSLEVFLEDLGDCVQIPTKTIANKFNDQQCTQNILHTIIRKVDNKRKGKCTSKTKRNANQQYSEHA